jgi:aspartate/methionine/tyrosine aminotransferase
MKTARSGLDAAGALLGMQPSRRSAVPPFIVMDVMEAAAAREALGHKVIHMEVGQPGTPAPRAALEAVKGALDRETLGYTVALGLPALRARIAEHYRRHYGLSVAPERVVVTTGSSAGFVLTFLALFDAGDKVALPAPGYPCYRHILTALGQVPVPIVTDAVGRWMPTAGQIEAAASADGIAGLVIASPANPTGTMLEGRRLPEIVEACRRHGVRLVADEIYHGLTYGAAEETALAHSPQAIVINSFSKYFSMTGWRVGWLVVPEELVRPIERLAQNLYNLAADRGAGGGHRRLRRHRGARGQQACLCGEPGAATRGTAQGRARAHTAGRRRLLSLCRRERFHGRQRGLHQADAGRHRRRRHARCRLRRRAG